MIIAGKRGHLTDNDMKEQFQNPPSGWEFLNDTTLLIQRTGSFVASLSYLWLRLVEINL